MRRLGASGALASMPVLASFFDFAETGEGVVAATLAAATTAGLALGDLRVTFGVVLATGLTAAGAAGTTTGGLLNSMFCAAGGGVKSFFTVTLGTVTLGFTRGFLGEGLDEDMEIKTLKSKIRIYST